MKIKDIQSLTQEDLEKKIVDLKNARMKMRFDHSVGTLNDKLALRKSRREIARHLTVLNSKRK